MRTRILIPVIFFLFTITALSQDKIFLMSENTYVRPIEFTDWTVTTINDYSSVYEYGYPGYNEKGKFEGDAFIDELTVYIVDESNIITAAKKLNVEGSWQEYDTLKSPSVSINNLNSKNYSGRFVYLTYKTKKGKIKSTSGILLRPVGENTDAFYEKAGSDY